jgi:hypothetical protein
MRGEFHHATGSVTAPVRVTSRGTSDKGEFLGMLFFQLKKARGDVYMVLEIHKP